VHPGRDEVEPILEPGGLEGTAGRLDGLDRGSRRRQVAADQGDGQPPGSHPAVAGGAAQCRLLAPALGLVQPATGEVGEREVEHALGVMEDEVAGQLLEPAANLEGPPDVEQGQRRSHHEVERRVHVIHPEEVAEGRVGLAAGRQQCRGRAVEPGPALGLPGAQLVLEQVSEQVVEAVAPLALTDPDHEHVGVVQGVDDGAGVRAVGERHRQIHVELLEHRQGERRLPLLVGQPVEDLVDEVPRDQAPADLDLLQRIHRTPGGTGQQGQLEAGDPPLGASHQLGHCAGVEGVIPVGVQQAGGGRLVEAEVALADLGQPALRPPPGEGEAGVAAGGERQAEVAGCPVHQQGEVVERPPVTKEVQVVEDHHHGVAGPQQVVQQSMEEGRVVGAPVEEDGVGLLAQLHGTGEGSQQVTPEAERVGIEGVERVPARAAAGRRPLEPVTNEEGLAVPGGCHDRQHPGPRGQHLAQLGSPHEHAGELRRGELGPDHGRQRHRGPDGGHRADGNEGSPRPPTRIVLTHCGCTRGAGCGRTVGRHGVRNRRRR
jgi:hypothetical protein